MGVQICTCDKQSEKIIKDSSFDCYKNNDQPNYINIITTNKQKANSNNDNLEDKKIARMKYKKMFKDNSCSSVVMNLQPVLSSTFSNNNNNNTTNHSNDEKYIHNIIKIQSYFRSFIQRKKIQINLSKKIEKEDNLSLKMNLVMTDTIFSSNSSRNSQISQENINNIENENAISNNSNKNFNMYNNEKSYIVFPFNIKNKLKINNYKYSGYINKLIKKGKVDDSSFLEEEKKSKSNKKKSEIVKEGFGKFIFNDGTEFCGIFHDNILQNYGKYTNINHKNKNDVNKDKEIIITDNLNYEDYIGEYKDYAPDGFGIYRNYITNLKITGIFKDNNISGYGIEESFEGGYIYTGEFVNNKKEGYGTIVWKDGSEYQGEFRNNQLNGYGIIKFPENKYYQGEVKNGRMDGFGEFFWNEEKKYIGNYKNDKRNGFGIFIFKIFESQNPILISHTKKNNFLKNYSAYIGFWKNGNMEGFGMKVTDEEIKYGLWENGMNRKYLETNFALKTYFKWIDKKYKIFFEKHNEILLFLEQCLYIEKEINPFKKENP